MSEPGWVGEKRWWGKAHSGQRADRTDWRRVNAVFVYAGLKIMVAESKGAESNGNKSEAAV